MLIHHPVLGYLDGSDGEGKYEWTADPKKAWRMGPTLAGKRLRQVLKYHAHSRLIPAKGAKPHVSLRACWTPKRQQVPQCASCPFRPDNDAEFGAVLTRLNRGVPVTAEQIAEARRRVKEDLQHSGDFVCHGTAYTPDMELRDDSEHRQCAGATEFWKGGGNA